MLGLTERVLREGPLNDAQRRDLDGVMINASLLLKQVNDLLDISKLESAKVTLFRSDIDLARLVRVTSASFEVVAAQRCCTLTVDTPDELMAQVDAEKVQRIICNLLSNAFKFIPEGGRVRCSLEVAGETASIAISDSGRGIPLELREKGVRTLLPGRCRVWS